ncbi:MAG: CBS domain-containing protein [Hyphomicrobium sp.]|jgi:CBS domain-containing protein|nr:CBS domain-containing protein [Hyphomicrobium sp.]
MKVKDVMHEGAEWVGPDTPVAELARLMLKHDIGSIPIGENDRLVGMVTDRDIVSKAPADGSVPNGRHTPTPPPAELHK